MRLYLVAIAMTLTATYVIVNGCIFHALIRAGRTDHALIHLYQLK